MKIPLNGMRRVELSADLLKTEELPGYNTNPKANASYGGSKIRLLRGKIPHPGRWPWQSIRWNACVL
jgi:hypothetical protein